MSTVRILFFTLTIFIYGCSSSYYIPSPEKNASVSTAKEKSDIDKGISYHDAGEYQNAINIYLEILKSNPDNAMAIHEIAYSYYMNKDYNKSLEYSLKGLEYNSDFRSMFYGMAGNSLDLLDKPKDAISVYKQGIDEYPDNFMNHYNLALVYIRVNDLNKAEKSLVNALKINPNHSSSNIALAEIYMNQGKDIQSILLICRFLALEPNTARSKTALNSLDRLLNAGVSKKDDKNIEITLKSSPDSDSKYSMLQLFLGMSRANNLAKGNESFIKTRLDELKSLFSMLQKKEGKEYNDYVSKYLFPYFYEISSNDSCEAFIYYIHQSKDIAEVNNWITDNNAKVDEIISWSKNYKWEL